MKKILLFIIMFLGAVMYVHSQTFADFEDGTAGPLTLHVMGCGAWDDEGLHPVSETFMVIDNPDPSGINTSGKVMKFIRRGTDDGGMPWGGFWANCNPNADVSVNKYVHIKVWKPRISLLKFKLEGGPSGTLETASMYAQTITGGWEDIVFDFTTMDGAYPTIAFMPDFEDPMTVAGVQEIFFDDILFSNDPNPIGGSIPLTVDFEDGTAGALTLHVMGCGDWDNDAIHSVSETFLVVDNPDPSGINKSAKVMKFIRRGTSDGGWPWGGFWANCDPKNNVTGNQYCHVKVWKPRISPLKFKIEGGPSGTLETASMNAQTLSGEWEDIVFDFTSMDGEYPVVAFMPDFEDPLTVAEVQEIYFDDIIFNNDPNPIKPSGAPLWIDFEDETAGPLTLHVMGCGDWDNEELHPVSETFMIVDNPDPTGLNTSGKVMKFMRRGTFDGGLPWGGFWANCEPKADITGKNYVHVKVWKPRVSPLKFKLEGGPSGTMETLSLYPQTLSGQWEDIVFDFTACTGEYPVIAFMPDFEDPLTMGNVQEIYFDDIIFSNNPMPFGTGLHDPSTIEVMVYPNPCDKEVNLINPTDLRRIIVYNVTGQVMISLEDVTAGQTVINTTDLVNGIYIITFEDNDGNVGNNRVIKYQE
ncbi:MAG: T9SS type A sorting domain-containing protein [Bacteroidales bacterium]|nr:T9SS type A sorting domain-containing protein [Bacteroidales bacterium]